MTITLRGHDWHAYPRGWRNVVACALGRHAAILEADDDGLHVRRCSCGASSFNGERWGRAQTLQRRTGTPETVEAMLERQTHTIALHEERLRRIGGNTTREQQ